MSAGNVLMVCLGNICRSPLAHGIFEQLSSDFDIRVDSAGTANYHSGNSPDRRSQATALQHGIDISQQRARQFTVHDFDAFDYIYVMDRSNLADVLSLARTEADRAKVALILGEEEVEDPYYGGAEGFEIVYQKIDTACREIIAAWKK